MANPTTNYGFVLPTSSDLVTELPADFEVALQGVDTRLKALNPETTLGDLSYGSATANTNTRLAIGTAGQVLTVAAGVPTWATPTATPTFYGCQLYKTGSQSTATNTNVEITWDSEQVDVGGFHDNVTNNGRITIPSGRAGKYLFIAQISWAATSTTGYRRHYIYKNGSSIASALQPGMSGTSTEQTLITSLVDSAAVGDYYQVFAFQNTGSALLVENAIGKSAFSAVYLGA